MNKCSVLVLLLAAIIFIPAQAVGQRSGIDPSVQEYFQRQSPFHLAIIRSPTNLTDSIRVDIFTEIPLDRLVFIAADGEFRSTYEVSIFAVDSDDMVQGTRIWREEAVRSRFDETRSEDQYHQAHTYFILSPGNYTFTANLVDLDNRSQYNASREIDITSTPLDELVISDILLTASVESQIENLVPYVRNEISEQIDSFLIYFTIHAPIEQPTSAFLQCTLMAEEDTTYTVRKTLLLNNPLSNHYIPVRIEEIRETEQTISLHLQLDSLEVEQSSWIHIVWTGFSHLIEDVEQAIEQTRYVASRTEIREMRKNEGEAKREALLAFWEEYDPTPNTSRNELMDEYYRRVAYANINFDNSLPGNNRGWETDMGMVHIIYGLPDYIERHPFDLYSKPYEVWFYYNKGWEFVFIDVNLVGDYRLVSPLYPSGSF